MPETGYIDVLVYTGNARIPLKNVAITVTAEDGTAIAMRISDRNGRIEPIAVPVPELSAGLTPDTGVVPYTAVDIYAKLQGFEQQESKNVQVFPDNTTRLNVELIPQPEYTDKFDKILVYDTPPQDL